MTSHVISLAAAVHDGCGLKPFESEPELPD